MITLTLPAFLAIFLDMSDHDPFEPTEADLERWTGTERKRDSAKAIAEIQEEIRIKQSQIDAMHQSNQDAAPLVNELHELRLRLQGYQQQKDGRN